MRWILAGVFGVIGGVISNLVFADRPIGGVLGQQVDVFAAAIGFAIAAPMGYLVGTLPFFSPRPTRTIERQATTFAPQVAGGTCSVCGKTIIFVDDGVACHACQIVVHLECTAEGECPACQSPLSPSGREG